MRWIIFNFVEFGTRCPPTTTRNIFEKYFQTEFSRLVPFQGTFLSFTMNVRELQRSRNSADLAFVRYTNECYVIASIS